MKSILLAVTAFSLSAAEPDFKSALIFYASFDKTGDADFTKGDPKLYNAPSMKAPTQTAGLPASQYVTRVGDGGKFGGHLRFQQKSPEMVFFHVDKNFPYSAGKFSGTVSFWLNLTPDEDLEPGYTDPLQVTSKQWNDAAFFVEFTKDEKPREFRLGSYADFKVWNPQNRPWEQIPYAEKPLIKVERPPFKRGQWTHVVFTFSNYNSGKADGETYLYLNGKEMGASTREQTFTWNIADAKVMLGLSYIGGFDELSIFNRALRKEEVANLYSLPHGVAALLK